ncbi:MAG: hypothetical protein KME54_26135 [Tolypothrix brevis GSE-NOS-MK-07-07A]|nr:hypothetical protein [Tolypothrix brevis GSE-NOS-MK-07-07A]
MKNNVETFHRNVFTDILQQSRLAASPTQKFISGLIARIPLKWTEILSQSSLDEFSYQPGNLFLGGLLRMVQDVSLRLFWRCLLDISRN